MVECPRVIPSYFSHNLISRVFHINVICRIVFKYLPYTYDFNNISLVTVYLTKTKMGTNPAHQPFFFTDNDSASGVGARK